DSSEADDRHAFTASVRRKPGVAHFELGAGGVVARAGGKSSWTSYRAPDGRERIRDVSEGVPGCWDFGRGRAVHRQHVVGVRGCGFAGVPVGREYGCGGDGGRETRAVRAIRGSCGQSPVEECRTACQEQGGSGARGKGPELRAVHGRDCFAAERPTEVEGNERRGEGAFASQCGGPYR